MSDWIEHNGGPQPVADDVWVEVSQLYQGDDRDLARWIAWDYKLRYRILNQHLIDAARLEGIRLGLEAAAKEASSWAICDYWEAGIRNLNPDTIAREAQDMGSGKEWKGNGMIIDTETKALLDKVFGERLRADTAETLGLRSALGVVMSGEGFAGLHPAAVSVLIRTALCNGLGEIPFGWSLMPTEDGKHELAVWVLDGVKDEMTKQLDEAQDMGNDTSAGTTA